MRISSPRTWIVIGLVVAIALVSVFFEGAPRTLPPDESIPERIVIREHPKLGGRLLVTLTDREDILKVMTSMPRRYPRPRCACFGHYELEFHDSTGVYRTVTYKPWDHLRDSEHETGQAAVPRRFSRIVGGLISEHR